MFLLLLLFLLAFPAFLLYHFYLKRLHLPPGPTPLPILGNGTQFVGSENCYRTFKQWEKEYGPIFTIWLGADPVVIIADYELMKQAFAKDEFAGRNFLNNHFRLLEGDVNGIIRTEGEQWKQMKKFTIKAMKDYGLEKGETENQVLEAIYMVIDEVKSEVKMGMSEHEVDRKVDLMTGSVINRMLFGYSFYGDRYTKFVYLKDCLQIEQEYFISLIAQMIESRPWLRHLPYFSKKYSENFLTMKGLFDFISKEIQERINARKGSIKRVEDDEKTVTDFLDQFIDQMEQSDQSDPDNFLKLKYLPALLYDLFLAGQETTSNTINFLILFLLLDQSAQENLHAELDSVWEQKLLEESDGKDTLKFRMADRHQLPYATAIVNESLRLANLLPLNLHKILKQNVEIGGFKLAKGTAVVNHIANVLYDEKIFPEPRKFLPERFLGQNGELASNNLEKVLAFGNGKRSCPGEPLARMELLLFTANFFHKFHVYPPNPLNPPKFEKQQTFAVKLPEFKCSVFSTCNNALIQSMLFVCSFLRNFSLHFLLPFAFRLFFAIYFAYFLLAICQPCIGPIGDREVYLGRSTNPFGENANFGEKMDLGECDGQKEMNTRRVEVAKRMLEEWAQFRRKNDPSTEKGDEKEQSEKWLQIGILASARPNRELIQLIGHFVAFWTASDQPYRQHELPPIFVCNTEPKGQKFNDLEEISKMLEGNIQIFDLNKNLSQKPTKIDAIIGKEAEDYWKCLRQISEATNESAEYILLLEDDVVPIPAFRQALSHLRKRLNQRRDIVYVKLYHPWAFRGLPWIIQSFALSFLYAFFVAKLANAWRKLSLFENILFVALITIGIHLLLIRKHFYRLIIFNPEKLFSDLHFVLLGGPNLSVAESCCTQAVLFRASFALRMAKTLANEKAYAGHAKDHILDESAFLGRQTDTNLVVHIGSYSVLRHRTVRTGEMFCRT